MNELERKIDAVLDAGEPASRLSKLRQSLAALLKSSKLEADRLQEYRRDIQERLELVERMAITDRNWRTAHDRLDDAAHMLRDAWLEPYAVEGARFKQRQSKSGKRRQQAAATPAQCLASELTKSLAINRDELGDWTQARELWDHLWSEFDQRYIRADERGTGVDKRYVFADGSAFTYEAFRKEIRRTRKKWDKPG